MSWRLSGVLKDRKDDERILRARIDMIAATLPYAALFNPLWMLLGILPLMSAFSALEPGQLWISMAAMTVLLISSVFAYKLWKTYDQSRGGRDRSARHWLISFIVHQAVISVNWATIFVAFWQTGNDVNNATLAIAFVVILAAHTITRTAHMAVYFAGIVPIFLSFWFCNLLWPHGLAGYMAVSAPLWTLFIGFIGYISKRHVDELILARFANEDLARALEEARDEALRKRFEAEAANASKSSFLANMSHELRTPLNAILGFSEIIESEKLGPVGSPRYQQYAGDIHESGTHLLSLINDLLDIAKIESGRMELEPHWLDAKQTLEDAVKLVATKARERRHTVTVDVAKDAPPLFADVRALKQIVINLVSNAVKYTPQEGRIEVMARATDEGEFELLVKDNGPGISKEKLSHVFEPFAQIDNRYDRDLGGTGLGLALVRNLAQLHGGRAHIESEVGQGTTVSVVLPVPPRQTQVAAA